MAINLDQFTQQLANSGLMSREDVASFVAGLPTGSKLLDSEQLARQLVRQKKLTAYQAKEIYAGRGKSLVLGNYVVLDKLGQGGMGLVLKAEHRRMERLVALKVLSPKVVRTPEALLRFQREVKAAARLMHPNIVTAFDADEAGGTHFLVIEYVDGSDLLTLVKQQGPLALDQALDCILQAARGLHYAHEHGVVHRDIKPANLLLDRQGTVKVLDMGLARLDSAGAEQDQLTGTGQIMGTVDYMAPEQALDTKHADGRADIYSLGVTLWYLLTGQPVYTGETLMEKLMAHQTQPVPSLRQACPAVSPPLEAVFCRMVAKTPSDRYQTMGELIAELEPFRGRAETAVVSVSTADGEDTKLDDFLQGLGPSAASQRPDVTTGRALPAAAVGTRIASAAGAAVDVLQHALRAPLGTNPPTEQRVPGGRLNRTRPAKVGTATRPPWWRDWKKSTAAGAGGLLLILLGIWVIVRDKDGREVARVRLPAGGSVSQESEQRGRGRASSSGQGSTTAKVAAPKKTPASVARESRQAPLPPWKLSPGAPPPAIAPFDAQTAKQHQAAWAKHLGVPPELQNSIGMWFVLIPPGEFDMGSTKAEGAKFFEQARAANAPSFYTDVLVSESPQHRVRITKPFYLGLSEVTQGQYDLAAESNPSHFKGDPNCPVENISWHQASAFCRKLAELPKELAARAEYRLPTEAEWEYACRAGTTTAWSCGDQEAGLANAAWLAANNTGRTHPVRQKAVNTWGLYDMHGNVWEWCQDWWDDGYYAKSPASDPTGASQGSRRAYRGGSWEDGPGACRSSCRFPRDPGDTIVHLGFRLVRTVAVVPR